MTSLWQATTTKTKESYISNRILSNDEPFDVVIVGGGITGVSTGLLLQEAGFRCLLIEANTLCFGTTGGTTAHLNTMLDVPYTTIENNFGKENAVLVAEAVGKAIGLVRENCEKYSIDAGFEEQTGYLFSQTDEQSAELEKIRKASADAGVEVRYSDALPVPPGVHSAMPGMQKVLVFPGQAKLHPTRYVLGMARAFQDMGGRVVEQCRVREAEEGDGIVVRTEAGDVRCRYLIYATHIPPGINILDTRCAPYRSYAMAVELEGAYPEGLIYDMEVPFHYCRTQVIDGDPYLIVGGEDHKTGHAENAQTCCLKLEAYIREHFPVRSIRYRWSSQYYEPVDGLPYIGHKPGDPGNVLVATGFGGNGMVYSGVAALLFRDLLLNSSDRYVKLFDPNRVKPVAGFSNFIKENMDVAKRWAGKLLPADRLEELAELAPGEGKVVRFEGETIALYRSEEGEMKALAPTCTHMGCHVTWNGVERSWDCPCHGARYGIDGTVLTGPADKDLERISMRSVIEK